jgi:hypothetical protein
MGWNASDTRPLTFTDCRVPEENLLGPRGAGFKQFLHILDIGRIGVAAMGVGLAQGALDEALKYAKERKAFGQSISKFQAIQGKLADMSTEIAAARLLVYKAAREKDAGRNFTLTAAQAKLKTGRLAVRCAEEAVQIHGGYGFIEEYPVCRFYRDAKILTIGEGTDEVIQQMVIARALGLDQCRDVAGGHHSDGSESPRRQRVSDAEDRSRVERDLCEHEIGARHSRRDERRDQHAEPQRGQRRREAAEQDRDHGEPGRRPPERVSVKVGPDRVRLDLRPRHRRGGGRRCRVHILERRGRGADHDDLARERPWVDPPLQHIRERHGPDRARRPAEIDQRAIAAEARGAHPPPRGLDGRHREALQTQ